MSAAGTCTRQTHEEDVDNGPHPEATKGEQLERCNARIPEVVPVRAKPAQRQTTQLTCIDARETTCLSRKAVERRNPDDQLHARFMLNARGPARVSATTAMCPANRSTARRR